MSLYRKYRPLTFGDVAGQEHVKTTLQNEIISGHTVHAYLFSGPRAVGKTTTARIFSRAINCEQRKHDESEPCNACSACVSLSESKTLDALEIDAASHTGVDNVRENIIAASRVANTSLKYKVFIIDEVHMLSIQAFNALLKLLEEPPSNVVFILATTEIHKVPATIISRCQRFDFKKIPPDAMIERLEKISRLEKKDVAREVLEYVVQYSTGCQRDAESLLGQLLTLNDKKIDLTTAALLLPISDHERVGKLVKNIVHKEAQEGISIIQELVEGGCDLSTFSNDVIGYLRDMLLIKNGASDTVQRSSIALKDIAELSGKMEMDRLLRTIECFSQANGDSRWFQIPQLPLEIAVVKSCT